MITVLYIKISTHFLYTSLHVLDHNISCIKRKKVREVTGKLSLSFNEISNFFMIIDSILYKSVKVHLHCEIVIKCVDSGIKCGSQIILQAIWNEDTEIQAICFGCTCNVRKAQL